MAPSADKYVIETRGLTKRYHPAEPPAVRQLDLNITRGEIFGFVGPNGAGKTTTLKMLMGMVPPTEGSGRVFGLDIVRDTVEIRRRVGFMSGEVTLYNHLRGNQLLDLNQHLHNGGNPERLNKLSEKFNVPLHRRIKSFSGGQKQQLALIAALAHDSDLLILDEPTKGLDPSKKMQFLELIQQRGEEGTSVIISSHVLSEIESICSRVGFIRDGVLFGDEEIEAVRKKLSNTIIATFDSPVDEDRISAMQGVAGVRIRGTNYLINIEGDGRKVVKQLADMPIQSLRYNEASLDDLYENLYLNNHDGGSGENDQSNLDEPDK